MKILLTNKVLWPHYSFIKNNKFDVIISFLETHNKFHKEIKALFIENKKNLKTFWINSLLVETNNLNEPFVLKIMDFLKKNVKNKIEFYSYKLSILWVSEISETFFEWKFEPENFIKTLLKEKEVVKWKKEAPHFPIKEKWNLVGNFKKTRFFELKNKEKLSSQDICNLMSYVDLWFLSLWSFTQILKKAKFENLEKDILEVICIYAFLETQWIDYKDFDKLFLQFFNEWTRKEIDYFFVNKKQIDKIQDLLFTQKIEEVEKNWFHIWDTWYFLWQFYSTSENIREMFEKIKWFIERNNVGGFSWLFASYICYYLLLSPNRFIRFENINLEIEPYKNKKF